MAYIVYVPKCNEYDYKIFPSFEDANDCCISIADSLKEGEEAPVPIPLYTEKDIKERSKAEVIIEQIEAVRRDWLIARIGDAAAWQKIRFILNAAYHSKELNK